jgi:hypothetical protein
MMSSAPAPASAALATPAVKVIEVVLPIAICDPAEFSTVAAVPLGEAAGPEKIRL